MKAMGERIRVLWWVRRVGVALSFLAAGGCASQVPLLVRQPLPENPRINAVQEDISHYQGSYVRWGGTIARIENKEDHTVLEIVALPLGDEGRPQESDVSPGRFLARIDGFLDPAIYQQGREITIYGVIEKLVKGQIGKHPYTFPLVWVKIYHLWRSENPGRFYSYPANNFIPIDSTPWDTMVKGQAGKAASSQENK